MQSEDEVSSLVNFEEPVPLDRNRVTLGQVADWAFLPVKVDLCIYRSLVRFAQEPLICEVLGFQTLRQGVSAQFVQATIRVALITDWNGVCGCVLIIYRPIESTVDLGF